MKTWTRLGLCFAIFLFSQQLSAAAPDLVFSGPVTVTPNPATPGSTITINYTVKNQGNGYAGSSRTALLIDNSSGVTVAAGDRLEGALPAGASRSVSDDFDLPASVPPGNYSAILILDFDSVLGQSNESNDFATVPFSIVPTSSSSPQNCLWPGPIEILSLNFAVAYEVNGVSYCGSATGSAIYIWSIDVPYGQKVKIRYALRSDAAFPCSSPVYLYLNAPAMGVNGRFLNSQGNWVSSLDYFQPAPPLNTWNDLYNDFPPKGIYYLEMGCSLQSSSIVFDVK